MDITKLKLIIWDLDETFWKGTLSEGDVELIPENVELVKTLVDKGVMNSICSKNDFDKTKAELEKHTLWQWFVFPSIDWTTKAARINGIIKRMALRPVNVLFIDDNDTNLQEAKFYVKDLNVMNVRELPEFMSHVDEISKDDHEHKRLKQYRILETKVEEEAKVGSTEDFLAQSEIRVDIDHDCINKAERIVEMVNRTNQLNFTKLRQQRDEVEPILTNGDYDCATVSVKDKYGDYGIVGFYALDRQNHSLLHFLFSCRTLGMGIEQYVYEQLAFPKLDIVGEVANMVEPRNIVTWINNVSANSNVDSCEAVISEANDKVRILLKGPCDLSSVLPYISIGGGKKFGQNIKTEFNYVNDKGVAITGFNDTLHIVEAETLSGKEIDALIADAPFLDRSAFDSKLLKEPWDIVFMSMLPDCHEGVYRHKASGHRICFSSFNYDITNTKNWDGLISGEYTNHNFKFTKEILNDFASKFEYIGHLPVEDILDNVKFIRQHLSKETTLVLMLGSEVECEAQTTCEFSHQADVHKEVNHQLIETFRDVEGIKFINYTELITSQKCFNGCTNHFSRPVYCEIAKRIVSQIAEYESQRGKGLASKFGVVMMKISIVGKEIKDNTKMVIKQIYKCVLRRKE